MQSKIPWRSFFQLGLFAWDGQLDENILLEKELVANETNTHDSCIRMVE